MPTRTFTAARMPRRMTLLVMLVAMLLPLFTVAPAYGQDDGGAGGGGLGTPGDGDGVPDDDNGDADPPPPGGGDDTPPGNDPPGNDTPSTNSEGYTWSNCWSTRVNYHDATGTPGEYDLRDAFYQKACDEWMPLDPDPRCDDCPPGDDPPPPPPEVWETVRTYYCSTGLDVWRFYGEASLSGGTVDRGKLVQGWTASHSASRNCDNNDRHLAVNVSPFDKASYAAGWSGTGPAPYIDRQVTGNATVSGQLPLSARQENPVMTPYTSPVNGTRLLTPAPPYKRGGGECTAFMTSPDPITPHVHQDTPMGAAAREFLQQGFDRAASVLGDSASDDLSRKLWAMHLGANSRAWPDTPGQAAPGNFSYGDSYACGSPADFARVWDGNGDQPDPVQSTVCVVPTMVQLQDQESNYDRVRTGVPSGTYTNPTWGPQTDPFEIRGDATAVQAYRDVIGANWDITSNAYNSGQSAAQQAAASAWCGTGFIDTSADTSTPNPGCPAGGCPEDEPDTGTPVGLEFNVYLPSIGHVGGALIDPPDSVFTQPGDLLCEYDDRPDGPCNPADWHFEVDQGELESTLQILPPDGADWAEASDLDADKQGDSVSRTQRMELHFFNATGQDASGNSQRFRVTRPQFDLVAYPKEDTGIVAPGGSIHRYIDYERPVHLDASTVDVFFFHGQSTPGSPTNDPSFPVVQGTSSTRTGRAG